MFEILGKRGFYFRLHELNNPIYKSGILRIHNYAISSPIIS